MSGFGSVKGGAPFTRPRVQTRNIIPKTTGWEPRGRCPAPGQLPLLFLAPRSRVRRFQPERHQVLRTLRVQLYQLLATSTGARCPGTGVRENGQVSEHMICTINHVNKRKKKNLKGQCYYNISLKKNSALLLAHQGWKPESPSLMSIRQPLAVHLFTFKEEKSTF